MSVPRFPALKRILLEPTVVLHEAHFKSELELERIFRAHADGEVVPYLPPIDTMTPPFVDGDFTKYIFEAPARFL